MSKDDKMVKGYATAVKDAMNRIERESEEAFERLRKAEEDWFYAVEMDPVHFEKGSPADRLFKAIQNYREKLVAVAELDLAEEEK